MQQRLKVYDRKYILSQTVVREGETKLGQMVHALSDAATWQLDLMYTPAKYVLLGIPEEVGVKANLGGGGTRTLWPAALRTFLNTQSTTACPGDNVLVLGHMDFDDIQNDLHLLSLEQLRERVSYIDECVTEVINAIAALGKIPLVVGGGHNNAYPIIKGVSKAMQTAINTVNLDAHSDFRRMEGRHSGNGFRYAYTENYLKQYAIVGLHEAYNAQNIIEEMRQNPDIRFSFFEDIFLNPEHNFEKYTRHALDFVGTGRYGIEIDLDCIERTASSAMTPCGISPVQARSFVRMAASSFLPCYLHLTEGAITLENGFTDNNTAKLVSYLLRDFLVANSLSN